MHRECTANCQASKDWQLRLNLRAHLAVAVRSPQLRRSEGLRVQVGDACVLLCASSLLAAFDLYRYGDPIATRNCLAVCCCYH